MGITVQIDSREQKCKHIIDWFDANGIKYIVSKMYCGDYQLLTNGSLCIDKKYGLQEVYGNIVHDHQRLKNECERAREAGIHLIFLVEENTARSLPDVAKWKNPRTAQYYSQKKLKQSGGNPFFKLSQRPPMSSEKLAIAMQTMSEKYGIEWRFCAKEDTARTIVEILTNGG